jgi:PleD family two-component response regulator
VATLLRRADEALYRSKYTGRNRTTAWRPDMAGRAAERGSE